MWPGFKSRSPRHNVVEFVVGSLLGLKGFSPGSTGFPFPEKPTLPTSNLIQNAQTHVEEAPERSVGKQIKFTFFYPREFSSTLQRVQRAFCVQHFVVFFFPSLPHHHPPPLPFYGCLSSQGCGCSCLVLSGLGAISNLELTANS